MTELAQIPAYIYNHPISPSLNIFLDHAYRVYKKQSQKFSFQTSSTAMSTLQPTTISLTVQIKVKVPSYFIPLLKHNSRNPSDQI